MKNHPLAFFSILASAVLSFSVARASEVALKGAETGEWTMDYDAALALAAEENLPLLLNFTGSDWCGWCKLMDSEVFSKEEWQEWAQDNIVLVTLDFPRDDSIVPDEFKERNSRLAEEFGIQGYPTYMILDSDGETIIGQLGAGRDKTPESFIEEVQTVLTMSPSNLEAKIAELGPEKGTELQAALDLQNKATEELEAWIATNPPRTPENEAKFKNFIEAIQEANAQVKSFF
ncbi:MAG: thioredoxin family protein [Puniceicoccales bacterium]